MGCGCNKKVVVNSYLKFDKNGDVLPNNEDHDLVGKNIITTTSKTGNVIQNITNSKGTVIGYIVNGPDGKNFNVFRGQVLQEK